MVTCTALAAPLLPIDPPNRVQTANRLLPVLSPGHLLGTDDLGRDTLSRMVWGSRPALVAGLLATLGALIPGTMIGVFAGYYGRSVDLVAMRVVDMLLAFPALLLAIALAAGLGPGLTNAMIAVSIVGLPIYARLARSEVLSLRGQEFVSAARAVGARDLRIISRHITPNLLAIILVVATLDVGTKIIITASLSFLGLGIQPPDADWGAMLARGRQFMGTAPQLVLIPGLAIAVVVLSLNLAGDALRDILDPRLRHG
jgi:peptide/nickel transport system permease protein